MSVSLQYGIKWIKVGSTGSGGISDGNNYVSSINFNSGTGDFTLSRVGLPSLVTNIPIPVYNGSETKIQAGSGGISITGIGSTPNPYIISGTLDGNNYLSSASYIAGLLTLNRDGLTPITVSIPESANNYPTSLTYTGNTLTMGRNGLSNLSVAIPQDGNNYITSATYINSILTLNRAGLSPLTVGIPAVDTFLLSTKAWRQKGDDSLAALTKARVFLSSNNSISVVRKLGVFQDTIDITSIDTAIETMIVSKDGTVTIDYIEGSTGDTIDLGVEIGAGAIDTTMLSTKAWDQKGLDSLGALTKAR
jgi:hypothetical protein